jgi:DNA-binding CsgD family transcriptional regulator
MSHVHQSDCEQLLALTGELYSMEDPGQLPRRLLTALRPLIAHEFGGCHVISPARRHIRPCYAPERPALPHLPETAMFPARHRDFWRLAATHPLHERLFNRPSQAWKLTDVMPRRVFRQTEFYNTLYRPLEVDCELTAVLPDAEAGAFLLVSLHRKHLDFTERDRALLNLLLPHVAGVRRRMHGRGPASATGIGWFDDEAGFYRWLSGRTPWGLTKRESDVLFWLGQGKTNAEIGRILGIAERTAETHSLRVYPKMGVENRYTAIATLNRVSAEGRS